MDWWKICIAINKWKGVEFNSSAPCLILLMHNLEILPHRLFRMCRCSVHLYILLIYNDSLYLLPYILWESSLFLYACCCHQRINTLLVFGNNGLLKSIFSEDYFIPVSQNHSCFSVGVGILHYFYISALFFFGNVWN